ncbi:hypothetical protein E8E11_011135 [Didymella keratinophila]|nr:hypothetical protein E8E11_011135 [Didymella keratinophila]
MRLLETTDGRTYTLTHEFIKKERYPPYAILSHTWETDQEVTFEDLVEDQSSKYRKLRTSLRLRLRSGKCGYRKLRFCAQQAKRDGLQYFWVDTCCINKQDPEELDRAINSMFQWYKHASRCYVYLSDVSTARSNDVSWQHAFTKSRWFTRGWTLQELLAPSAVEFFSREGTRLGTRHELRQTIHDITDIPLEALSGAPLSNFGVDERLSWAVERQTTREEDEVYALLGIFDVKLPFVYTEGYDRALRRLLDAIERFHTAPVDQTDQERRILKSNIPFRRDKDFVSRKSLAIIQDRFERSVACISLVGLGGVGKSQIAVEYAYKVLDKSSSTWVFWVHAETKARFAHSYQEIAETIKMKGWDDPTANAVQLVNDWLRNDAMDPWLLIVDSADDENVLLDDTAASRTSEPSPAKITKLPLPSILSPSYSGSILVTTRNREVAGLVADLKEDAIEVGPMDDDEAYALLRKRFNSLVERDEAMTLFRALDNIPLALTQAAAFINRTPRMSISRYLEALNENRIHVLEKGQVDVRRDREASNSTTTTWQLSFDYIRSRCPGAARLLSLMSFFDRRNIPRSLLKENYEDEQEHGRPDLETELYMLTSFYLVTPNADGTAFDMHGLVQHATRDWLHRHGEHLYWKEMAIVLMDKHYPVGHFEDLTVCAMLYPHGQAVLHHIPQDEDALEAWASLCFKVAWYLAERGDIDKAYHYVLDSYDVRKILWGEDAPLTLDSLNSLALILHRSGRYVEAKERYQRALQGQVKTLGAKSRDALNTMVNLAGLHNDDCNWTEAEVLLAEAAEICTETFGPDHSLTLNAKSLLANTYRSQGRGAEAQKLELQMLDIHENKLGVNHPQTLAVKSNLAFTYRKQGCLEAAEQLQLQLLQVYSANPDLEIETLALKSHLANTYRDQGRLSEASTLQSEILQASQIILGLSHFDTLTRMSQLSTTYCAQTRYMDALDLESQTSALRESILGPEHVSTLDSKAILATTYRGLGRLAEAESLGLQVLTHHRQKFGESHPLTLESKIGLATTLRAQGHLEEASNVEEDVARIRGEIKT